MPSTPNQKKNQASTTMSDDDSNPPERQGPEELLTDTATANAANAREEVDQGLTGNGHNDDEEEKDGEEKDDEENNNEDEDSSDEDNDDDDNLSDTALAAKLMDKEDESENEEQNKNKLQQQMEKVFGKVPENYDPEYNIPGVEYCQNNKYRFTREQRPKKKSKNGIGLELANRGPTETVSVLASTGDKMYTKEPYATYYYKVMFRIAELRRRKDLSNEAATGRIFKEQVKWLGNAGGYLDEEGSLFSTRHQKFFFRDIMGGYNKNGNEAIGNRTLHNIAIIYAKMRTGNLQSCTRNEVLTAIDAIRVEFLRVFKNEKAHVGKEQWCFPILLLLNDHLDKFAKIPPIRHHPWLKFNEKLYSRLLEDTDVIWAKEHLPDENDDETDDTPKKKKRKTPKPDLIQIGVERRPQVQEHLLAFLNRYKGTDEPDYVMTEGVTTPPDTPTPSKKRRAKVDLGVLRLH